MSSRKKPTQEDIESAVSWIDHLLYGPDAPRLGTIEDRIREVAWNAGYENERMNPTLRLLGDHFKVDIDAEWQDGFATANP